MALRAWLRGVGDSEYGGEDLNQWCEPFRRLGLPSWRAGQCQQLAVGHRGAVGGRIDRKGLRPERGHHHLDVG